MLFKKTIVGLVIVLGVGVGLLAWRAFRPPRRTMPATQGRSAESAPQQTPNRQLRTPVVEMSTNEFAAQLEEWRQAWASHARSASASPGSPFVISLTARKWEPAEGVEEDVATAPATSRGTLPCLIQLAGPVTEGWKAALVEAGCLLRGYVPEHAFLCEVPPDRLEELRQLPWVRWIGRYRSEYKVHPFLLEVARLVVRERESSDQSDVAWPALEVNIRTLASEDATRVARELKKLNVEVLAVHDGRRWGLIRAKIIPQEATLANIANLSEVQWIEEAVPRKLFNDFAVMGQHLNVTNVWVRYGLTGRRQVIGHADTGLDAGAITNIHPDFAGRVRVAIARGRTGDWSDPHGHGTHTAGSILGDGTASTGQFQGVAFEADLVHQSVMDAGGGLGGLPADLYELYDEAFTNEARIHSDSWGSAVYGQYTVDSQSSDEFMWDYPEMLLVFAAGNEGRDGDSDGVVDPDSIGAPGTAKNLLTVGAAESDRAPGSGGYSSMSWGYAWPSQFSADPIRNDYISQSADMIHQGLAAFSSRGPTDDGRTKPDVVAPGTDVISCRSRRASGTAWGTHPNTNYLFSGGTSMATPLVAGFAALVRQYYLEWRGLTNPSAALIKATVLNGARSLTPGQYGSNATREIPPPPRPNFAEGWGQPDLLNTLFPPGPRLLAACDTNRLSTGETNRYVLYLAPTLTSSVMLVYSDYPATAGSGKKLVNDLDLLVLAPNGQVFYPNGRAAPDRTNNVEGVDFLPPVSGVYTVQVSAFTVPNGPQPYALVFSGGWQPIYAETLPNTTNHSSPYELSALITSLGSVNTDALFVYWNTDGGSRFEQSRLTNVLGHDYRAALPAQPTDTTIFYYYEGMIEGQTFRWPTGAPTQLLSFRVTSPVTLVVTGEPVLAGSPMPAYGEHTVAAGIVITAEVQSATTPSNHTRYVCAGWTGEGSVPSAGVTLTVTFALDTNSTLTWLWTLQYGLVQTGAIPDGWTTTTWWNAGATGATITAPWSVTNGTTTWAFAYWTLDGARQPDASSSAVNPVTDVLMATARWATAVYVPESLDSDANGLPDWWELRYFGETGVVVGADADGDGYDNASEFSDQSDPRDSGSVPYPPQIVHEPLSTVQTTPAPWRVSASISDSGSVASVMLTWTRNAAVTQEVPMTLSAGVYTNAIAAPGTNGDAFVYHIIATDAAGLTATSGPYALSVVYPVIQLLRAGTQTLWAVPNGAATSRVVVANFGNTTLAWSAQFIPSPTNDVGWWSAAPTNGTLAGAAETDIVVTMSAWALTSGATRTLLTDVLSNDPTCPSNRLSLVLNVGFPPTITPIAATNVWDTNGPYAVEAMVTPGSLVDTNALFVFWNTNGGASFQPAVMVRVTGDLYRAELDGQPVGARVRYFYQAAGTNGLVARDPANAPTVLREFTVVEPVHLVITGFPASVGTVSPSYGQALWPSGCVINATATETVWISSSERYRLLGWTGSGSVPTTGAATSVSFTLRESSSLTWQWAREFALAQTSSLSGVLSTAVWWAADSTGATVAAEETVVIGNSRYRFVEWRVDGARWPSSGRAQNPATGIIMNTGRVAEAVYYPEDRDSDGDGLPDWWVVRYGLASGELSPEARYWFDRRLGRELALDGGSVSIGSLTWASTDVFSVALWARPDSVEGIQGIMGSTGAIQWAIYAETSAVCVAAFNAGGQTALWLRVENVLETNRWRHLATVFDGAHGEARLYVDGKLSATAQMVTAFANDAGIAIGRALLPDFGEGAFTGRLDEIGFWSRVLSDEEIAALRNRAVRAADGNILWVSFDEDAGGIAWDFSGWNRHAFYEGNATSTPSTLLWDWSGNGHHGVYVGGGWTQDAQFGEVLTVDGTEYAIVPHDTSLMPTAAVSIVARALAERLDDWHSLAIKTANDWWADGYGMYAQGVAGTQAVSFVNDFSLRAVGVDITTGTWSHLAGVYSGTNLQLYVGGTLVAQSNLTEGILGNTGPLYLGAYGEQWGWVGRLREVRLYTQALTSADVAATRTAADDPDGDGWLNAVEYLAGSDPLDAGSVPTAPGILHVPLGSPRPFPAPWPVTATITSAAPLIDATLWWRRNTGIWNFAQLTVSNGTCAGIIPAPGLDGDQFEYRIEAVNGAGLRATSGPHSFVVSYPMLHLAPASLEGNWLLPGAATSRVITLSNTGTATLAWQWSWEGVGLSDDVEWGAGGWTHGGTGDLWHVTTNRSFSTTHSWYCGDSETRAYENGVNAWLLSPPIQLVQGARLAFRYWIDSEVDENNPPYAHDGGVVEISTNGVSFAALVPSGGYPYRAHGLYGSPFARDTPIFAGTGGWQEAAFDLTNYAGHTVWLRFRFGSDEAFAVGEGWYLDDLRVTPYTGTDSWFGIAFTNGLVEPGSVSNIAVWLSAANWTTGDSRAAQMIWTCNDPLASTRAVALSVFAGFPITLEHAPLTDITVTDTPYSVSVNIVPNGWFDTNSLFAHLVASTNGGTAAWTSALSWAVGFVWTGAIPAQPYGAQVSYCLRAEAAGVEVRDPADAPATWHMFRVMPPVSLVVTGEPLCYGSPWPAYGESNWPQGIIITARAPDVVSGGTWWACTGWLGSGSVPASGAGNEVAFALETNSFLRWQWEVRYRLLQTSTPASVISTSAWFTAGAFADTVTAPLTATVESVAHRFTGWYLDGVRQSNTNGKAVNPVTGLLMTTSRAAVAQYLPEDFDGDEDGLPDAWEWYYFGHLGMSGLDDPDGDGYANLFEWGEDTDPADAGSYPMPPVIQHVPLDDPQTTPAPWMVFATVTDNVALRRVPVSGMALAFTNVAHYAIHALMAGFPSNAITVEFWMKSWDRARRGTPFSYAVPGSFDDANEFTLYNHNTFLIYRDGVYTNTRVSASDGQWHHIAATWRGSDGRARLYLDGVPMFEGTLAPGTSIRPNGALVLGQDQDSYGGSFSADDAFMGLLDEVRVWNYERSASEILQTLSNRLSGSEDGLVGYWNFDGTNATAEADRTRLRNDLTLVGPMRVVSEAFEGSAVTLWWRRNGAGWMSTFMTEIAPDEFRGEISPPGQNSDVFDYRIEAQDEAGLVSTNGPHRFDVRHAQAVVAPSAFTNGWLAPGAAALRTLTISNAGSGTLVWMLAREDFGFRDDVESGTNAWVSGGAADQWHIATRRSFSPSHAWFFGDEEAGTYANYADAILDTPLFSVAPQAQLTFRHWADMEMQSATVAWDGGIVEISTNRGLSFEKLTPVGGYPYTVNGGWGQPFPGGSGVFAGWGGWTQAVFDLSAYAGAEAILRFHFGSDMVNDYPAEGWFIDDVLIVPGATTADWLRVSAAAGSLGASAATDVEITFDAVGSAAGEVLAQKLVLISNDPITPTSSVPVVLRVGTRPSITHEPLANQPITATHYVVEAQIEPVDQLQTNKLQVLWNTNGSSALFNTSAMLRVTGNVFRAFIGAQPAGTRVSYYISASTVGDIEATAPSNAPLELYAFDVAEVVLLTVTGSPLLAGTVWPDYGVHEVASGAVITAVASPGVATAGSRQAAAGWTGTGSVPVGGADASVTFTCRVDSALNWLWETQYLLSQSSTVRSGVSTATWWFAGSTAQTVAAAQSLTDGGTNYVFAHWLVDGARWPDATNIAVNPASGVIMNTARVAIALYVRGAEDRDEDDLPDWWEYHYFGSLAPWRTDDPDGDGFSNLAEYRDRTNPRDASSFPQPPVIVHVPLSDPQTTPAPWSVTATIIDNYVVADAVLRWRKNTDAWQNVPLTNTAGDDYVGSIAGPAENGDVFAYYIESVDPAGWRATNGPYGFAVALPKLSITPTNLGYVFAPPHASTSIALQVQNAGSGTLAWSAEVVRVGFWDGAESGTNGWTHGGTRDLWHISDLRSAAGTQAWYAGSGANRLYTNNMDAWLITPTFIVPTGCLLRFRSWMDVEMQDAVYAYDAGVVELSVTGGPFFAVAPTGGYPYRVALGGDGPFTNGTPCLAGTGGWQEVVMDLSPWAGHAAQVRFRFGSDSSKVREGWYVDDVFVYPGTGSGDWISVAPTSGSLPAASAETLWVDMSAADLGAGTWWPAEIRVAADQDAGDATAAVVFVVYGGGSDFDADQMSDEWEIAHGFNPSDASDRDLDQDGDGQSNYAEFVAGTDPWNTESYFRAEAMALDPSLRVRFNAVSGRVYRLQLSTNLMSGYWSNIAERVADSNAVQWLDHPATPQGLRYYRMTVEP